MKTILIALVAFTFAATSYAVDSYPPTPCEPIAQVVEPCAPVQDVIEPCAPVSEMVQVVEPCAPVAQTGCDCANCKCKFCRCAVCKHRTKTKTVVSRQVAIQREGGIATIPVAIVQRVFAPRRIQTTRTVKLETVD